MCLREALQHPQLAAARLERRESISFEMVVVCADSDKVTVKKKVLESKTRSSKSGFSEDNLCLPPPPSAAEFKVWFWRTL